MVIGLIGAGSLAGTMARGWASCKDSPEKVLITDSISTKASDLASETGGEAISSNGELVRRSDAVVLCIKPVHLHQVAKDINEVTEGFDLTVISVLGATPIEKLKEELAPGAKIFRLMPNIAMEVRKGLIAYSTAAEVDDELERLVVEQFEKLGKVIKIEEDLLDAVTAVASCSPAFFSKAAEAIAVAGASHGLDADLSRRLVASALAGTGAVLEKRDGDAKGIIQEVASPGGSTEVGISILDEHGVDNAFSDAVDGAFNKCRGADKP